MRFEEWDILCPEIFPYIFGSLDLSLIFEFEFNVFVQFFIGITRYLVGYEVSLYVCFSALLNVFFDLELK